MEGQAVVSSSNLQGLTGPGCSPLTCRIPARLRLFPFSSGNAGNGTYYAGAADRVDLKRNGLHLIYGGSYQDATPGFVTVPGFVNRVDLRDSEQHVGYVFRPKQGWIVAWGPGSTAATRSTTKEHGSTPTTRPICFQGRGQTTVRILPYEESRERLRPQDFAFLGLPGGDAESGLPRASQRSVDPDRVLSQGHVGGELLLGRRTELCAGRSNAAPQWLLGRLNTGAANLTFRPVKPLKIENTYLFERLRATNGTYLFEQSSFPEPVAGSFNDHIVRSKWNWQFTPQLSVRVILQYNGLLAGTPGLGSPYTYLPTQKEFNADFLVTYLVHPGTAIYVGYNSDLQNLNVEQGRRPCRRSLRNGEGIHQRQPAVFREGELFVQVLKEAVSSQLSALAWKHLIPIVLLRAES
jgi:hypothetical protein